MATTWLVGRPVGICAFRSSPPRTWPGATFYALTRLACQISQLLTLCKIWTLGTLSVLHTQALLVLALTPASGTQFMDWVTQAKLNSIKFCSKTLRTRTLRALSLLVAITRSTSRIMWTWRLTRQMRQQCSSLLNLAWAKFLETAATSAASWTQMWMSLAPLQTQRLSLLKPTVCFYLRLSTWSLPIFCRLLLRAPQTAQIFRGLAVTCLFHATTTRNNCKIWPLK